MTLLHIQHIMLQALNVLHIDFVVAKLLCYEGFDDSLWVQAAHSA